MNTRTYPTTLLPRALHTPYNSAIATPRDVGIATPTDGWKRSVLRGKNPEWWRKAGRAPPTNHCIDQTRVVGSAHPTRTLLKHGNG